MAVGCMCFQCEAYEQSMRNEVIGICHEGNPYLVRGGRPGCKTFRLRVEKPPEDAGEVATGTLETFTEAPGLEDRVEALESKVDGLEEETRMLTKRVGKLEALDRFDDRRANRLDHGLDELRGRIEQLEEVSHDHMA